MPTQPPIEKKHKIAEALQMSPSISPVKSRSRPSSDCTLNASTPTYTRIHTVRLPEETVAAILWNCMCTVLVAGKLTTSRESAHVGITPVTSPICPSYTMGSIVTKIGT